MSSPAAALRPPSEQHAASNSTCARQRAFGKRISEQGVDEVHREQIGKMELARYPAEFTAAKR